MEYAMACRKRSRTKREEEAHITWYVKQRRTILYLHNKEYDFDDARKKAA